MTVAIEAPTGTDVTGPLAPGPVPESTKSVAERCADLIASTLTTTQLIDSHFYRTTAIVADNGSLTVRIRQVNFDRPDCVVELLLHPTPPITIAMDADTEVGAVGPGAGGAT